MAHLFVEHPRPWEVRRNYAECGNGSAIHGIFDAKGECIVNTYGSYNAFNALWELYNILTKEQIDALSEPVTADADEDDV